MKYLFMILAIIVRCTFLVELEVQESIFGSYMITRNMEYFQGYYSHEDGIIGLHFSMGNIETEFNGHRGRVDSMELHETMRNL